ncbi:MAG: hypothetical protein IT385_09205 [Deltaproteobacteria bacterium]|nr:hypothetical protein [Deltaproteobacteria bacterium]
MPRLALAALTLLALATPAHAIIHTEVVVVLGVELDPEAGRAAATREAALARQGLGVFVTPSITYGDQAPTYRYVVGRALGTLPVDRDGHILSLPLPDPATQAEVARALTAAGYAAPPRLLALVQQRGGK